VRALITHSGIAVPILLDDISTDTIIPTKRAIHVPRGKLGRYAFEPLRYDLEGERCSGFALNMRCYSNASILIAGRNFGCGSSREMAAWAIDDMGFRVLIAKSFGEIFFQNCCKIGLLPLTLAPEAVERLAASCGQAESDEVNVDLQSRTVRNSGGEIFPFEFSSVRRDAFLRGLDDIQQTLRYRDSIERFMAEDRTKRPWIYIGPPDGEVST
jgi:3-isopropylmalate/(R)-2-methylmalate dehydratase small subunit